MEIFGDRKGGVIFHINHRLDNVNVLNLIEIDWFSCMASGQKNVRHRDISTSYKFGCVILKILGMRITLRFAKFVSNTAYASIRR